MADNSMYWSDQSGWYQQPPPQPQSGPPTYPQQQQHPNSYPSNSHSMQSELNHNNSSTSPPQQLSHAQQQSQMLMQQPMMQNGSSNSNAIMQHPTPQGHQQAQPPPPLASNQSGPQMNYSPHMNLHNESHQISVPGHHQTPPESTGYPMHQPQQASYPQHQPPPPPPQQQQSQMYSHSPQNSYPPNMIPPQGNPIQHHPNMQQPPQHHYPQQYSPPSYWNSGPPSMHSQANYGQPQSFPPNVPQTPIQPVPTPPSGAPSYHHSHNAAAAPPPQQQQPPPPPPPHNPNMPYDSRGSNMSANYGPPYQQPAAGYYSSNDGHPPADHSVPYDISQQQAEGNQQPWSNGYYQPSQSPYPSVINSYPMPYNTTPPMSQPLGPPPPHQTHPPHYPPHHQPQQSQAWPPPPPPPNINMPIIERNKAGEKKPVKPRAPRKQSNPNAPTGRRKRPVMTEEHKQSGYAKFYQKKRKDLGIDDFNLASKTISEIWKGMSEEEKSVYVEDVSRKRKELLKKKASQQAQNLLGQGIKQDQDGLN